MLDGHTAPSLLTKSLFYRHVNTIVGNAMNSDSEAHNPEYQPLSGNLRP